MIEVINLCKKFNENKDNEILVLNNIQCTIEKAKFTTIVGPSGSGKTTFLKCISGLEQVTSGRIIINGKTISLLKRKEMDSFRKKDIAYIFQEYNLISDLTLIENICFDNRITDDIRELIIKWGLSGVVDFFPLQCSGGQQQKAAILRALLKNTKIIFCDEPTGALDSKSSQDVLSVLKEIQKKFNTTIVMITHNNLIKEISDVVISIQDGSIKSIYNNVAPLEVDEVEWRL